MSSIKESTNSGEQKLKEQVVDSAKAAAPNLKRAHPNPAPPNAKPQLPLVKSEALKKLVEEVDPHLTLDTKVEEMLLAMTEEFVDKIVQGSCKLANHRAAQTLGISDVQLYLEQTHNMVIPGFGTDKSKLKYKPVIPTQAHQERMKLIRKTLKKNKIFNTVQKNENKHLN